MTLPAPFRDLTGIACRLALRDGLRPEIVLQPDLRAARLAFSRLWDLLREALSVDAPSMPPLGEAALTLWPAPASWGGPPRLAWHDGLLISGDAPHDAPAVARCIAAFAQLLAPPLGIAPELAAGFGATAGFALAGHAPAGTEADTEIGAALLARDGIRPGDALAVTGDALSAPFAAAGRPALVLLRDAHLDWTADPARLAEIRAAWRRGIALELQGT